MASRLSPFLFLSCIALCFAAISAAEDSKPPALNIGLLVDFIKVNITLKVNGNSKGPIQLKRDYYVTHLADVNAACRLNATADVEGARKQVEFDAYNPARDKGQKIVYVVAYTTGFAISYTQNDDWKLIAPWK